MYNNEEFIRQERLRKADGVMLKHPSGMVKYFKLNFNWWMLIFGAFVTLIYADFKTFFKWLGMIIISSLLLEGCLGYLGDMLSWFIAIGINAYYVFKYNELRVQDMIEKGWYPLDEMNEEILRFKGIL